MKAEVFLMVELDTAKTFFLDATVVLTPVGRTRAGVKARAEAIVTDRRQNQRMIKIKRCQYR